MRVLSGKAIARHLAAVTLAAGLAIAPQARACAFHGYAPDPTLIDVVLATDQVILARIDPANPSRFLPVEALVGPPAADIPLPVSSATRARLAADPSATVLLARIESYGPWQELAVLDTRYRAIIDDVLAQDMVWAYGAGDGRLLYFARLLNDPNPDIRSLAFRELDRVSYRDLRRLQVTGVANLRQDLVSGPEDLRPIRVLLAGLSQDRAFSPILASGLDTAVRSDVPYMGAYATALIELEGAAGVGHVLSGYLSDPGQPQTTQIKLIEALAIQHKTAPRDIRRAIERGVADLIRAQPGLRDIAAQQFGFLGNRVLD